VVNVGSVSAHTSYACDGNGNGNGVGPICDQVVDDRVNKELHDLREEIACLRARVYSCDGSGTFIQNIQTQNNIHLNISDLRPFGDEDTSYISEQYFKTLLDGKGGAIRRLTEVLCCDDNHPENMNVLIKNKKGTDAMIYDGEKFSTENKQQVYLRRLVVYRELIRNLMEQFQLNRRERNKCSNIIENLNSIIEEEDHLFISEETDDDDANGKYINTVIDQIENLLYDKRTDVGKIQKLVQTKTQSKFVCGTGASAPGRTVHETSTAAATVNGAISVADAK